METQEYIVEVVLENKPAARDPTGDTIKRDLLAKKGYDKIKNVRSGQYLRIYVQSADKNEAKDLVESMCNDLRIFNPVTQNLTVLKVTKNE